uniref:VP7 n=1 Tax=viral metagenome TaxID=1070528 RepID=A0A2V0RB65_9ZZZZ
MSSTKSDSVSKQKSKKNHKIDPKFYITRRRAQMGSFVVADAETNMDPGGHIANKLHSRVFILNGEELMAMMEARNYTYEQAICYVEAVSQVPEHKKGGVAYTGHAHPITTVDPGEVDILNAYWFDNSWTGNSWTANAMMPDGGPPCFWTKNIAAPEQDNTYVLGGKRGTHSKAIKAKLVREGVPYYVDGTNPSDFSNEERSKVVPGTSVHAVTGVFEGKEFDNTTEQHHLFHDDIQDRNGKQYLILKHDAAMIERAINSFSDGVDVIKSDPFSEAHERYEKQFPNRGWKVGYDQHPTFDDVCNKLKAFLMTYPTEEKHIWIQGELENMTTTETIRRLKSECIIAFTRARSSNATTSPTIMTFWNTPILASQDLAYAYGGRTPQRIPVIPWRPTNFGMRIMAPGLKPQLFPSSSLMRDLGIKFSTLEMNGSISKPVVYTNYSGFVKLVPLRRELNMDFGWLPMGNNEYAMANPREVSQPLFMVEDEAFFMGLGSVVTGHHSIYGLGRSEPELWEQLQRKLKTGHDTSGHMIAAPLAYKAQMLWYLQEVMINMTQKRSIYSLPFKEPTGGVYHTTTEYVHALNDMNKLDRGRVYPFYARQNVSICADFIRAMA